MKRKIDSTSFRQIMGCFTTGVAVVTMRDDELGAVGLTVNSLTSVSLEPPLLLFCLEKKAHLYKAFRGADLFMINILSAGQQDISRHFASRDNPRPKKIWDRARQTCPVLRGTLGWALCKPYKIYQGGDHIIIVGEVIDLHQRVDVQKPLTYFHGHYRDLAKETSGARK